jgi:hypothetical protein
MTTEEQGSQTVRRCVRTVWQDKQHYDHRPRRLHEQYWRTDTL